MPTDPDELKIRRIKSEQQIQDIQNYMEEQNALQDATGKLGYREIKQGTAIGEKISNMLKRTLNFLKRK